MATSPREEAKEKQNALFTHAIPMVKELTEEITDLDRQIGILKDKRTVLNQERKRLQKLLYETPTFEKRGGTGQGLYVHTRYFLPYVEDWITNFDSTNGKGAKNTLSITSGVSGKNIRSWINGSVSYAGINSVDRILTAIGRQDLLENMPFKTTLEIGLGGRSQPPQKPPSQYYEE